MANIALINQIFLFLNITIGSLLAFWVFLANWRGKINQIFFILTILTVLWVIFSFLGFSSEELKNALIWYRLNYSVVALFFIASYFFSIYFPKKNTENKFLTKFVLILCSFLFVFSIFTNLIINSVEEKEWGVEIIFGKAKPFYYISTLFLTILILYNLFKKYFILTKEEQLKVQYVLIGILIFALANLIFNIGFAFLKNTIEFSHFGDYSLIFILIFTALAIVKRELFGIKVILTALLVGSIAILLFWDTLFLTQQFHLQVIKGVTLIIFLYFGYLLIKSVIQEIQRREEVEKINKAKTEFISMASHQLRTPLTAIKGYISMIMEGTYGEIPQIIKEKLNNVFISNERLINIVNELLDISKIDLGKMELKKEWVDIGDIIKNCYDELKILAQQKNLEFKLEKPKEPLKKIYVDPLRIRQAFLNLIDNAIKYTPHGKVEIKISQKEKSILITISDTGEGLDEKEKGQLFESFTRGSAGLTYFIEGTGLGLSITKKIIELHKGKVWAESEGKGKGSIFFVELPIEEIKNNLTHF